ncbi:MAG: transcriptional regulator [Gemmatimonadales bacterium]|nr:MAG: transcriptional regulator [Gemmatimonadales bacterium]
MTIGQDMQILGCLEYPITASNRGILYMGKATNPGNAAPPHLLAHASAEGTAHILKCLGHPTRLRILDFLDQVDEATVTEIHEALDVSQPVASQHLTTMWDKGILLRRREGVNVHYQIGDPRARTVLSCVRGSDS